MRPDRIRYVSQQKGRRDADKNKLIQQRGPRVRVKSDESLDEKFGPDERGSQVSENPTDDADRRRDGHGVYRPIAFLTFSTVAAAIGVIRAAPSASTRAT